MKRYLLFSLTYPLFFTLFSQIPAGYYNSANEKSGHRLHETLCQIITAEHRSVSYTSLWTYFDRTDVREDSLIWDIYSDHPGKENPYNFLFQRDQCNATGGNEGVCYNREHLFCQSWFGKRTDAPYSDLFHIYPVDGYINSIRNNNAYGEISSPTRTFSNGSKFGKNSYPQAPVQNAFEPVDAYKGDIARSLFYMSTRYLSDDYDFDTSYMTVKSQLKPWAINMLIDWHLLDPVSEKERERNNAIYTIQHNRNPFIDYPELVNKIWGKDSIYPFYINDTNLIGKPRVVGFDIVNAQLLQLSFDRVLEHQTAADIGNYRLNQSNKVAEASHEEKNVFLFLQDKLIEGKAYRLSISGILSDSLQFIKDTTILFTYGYPSERDVWVAWTFDTTLSRPATPDRIFPEINYSQAPACLYLDGSAGSSPFTSSLITSYAGSLLGDPRITDANAGRSLSIEGIAANQQGMVFRFSTFQKQSISLTFACRKTTTGFNTHQWEWSLDGQSFFLIENSNTIPSSTEQFQLQTLDLTSIAAINDRDSVFLRLTLDGTTNVFGNNRFDNIVIHTSPVNKIASREKNRADFFKLYPNPATRQVKVELLIAYRSNQIFHLHLVDSSGKLISTRMMKSSKEDMDTVHLAPGIYIIRVVSNDGLFSGEKKLIIQ